MRPKRVLLFTSALALLPGFATATDLPGRAPFVQAADAVIAAQGQAGVTPPPPVTDPRVKALLDKAADIDAIFGKVPLTVADLGPVMDMCGKANQITVAYGLANIASLKPPEGQVADPVALQPRVIELGNRNAVSYQDAILPMLAFNARCMSRAVPLLTEFLRTLPAEQRTPARMAGLRQMRGGITNMMVGAIRTIVEAGISVQNRHLVASAAADTAPTFAAMMPVADRKVVEQAALQTKALAAATEQSSLEAIARAYADERCEGLCAVAN